MKIAISIGHGKSANGGYDSGAVSADKKHHEYDLARGVGEHLDDILSEYECEVYIINTKKDKYLYDRIKYIKNMGADLALELHLNAFNQKARGSECYHKASSKSGKKLAAAIAKNISNDLGVPYRGAKTRPISKTDNRDYFGFVREIPCESLLVETVFVDNPTDCAKLLTSEGRRKCAQAIANAIIATYGLKKKAAKKPEPAKPAPSKPASKFEKGDKVQIIGKYYATGQKIPAWAIGTEDAKGNLKRTTYTVENDPAKDRQGRVLLSSIRSYMWPADLILAENKPTKPKKIEKGDTVTIKPGAVYGGLGSARGKKVGKSYLSPRTFKVKSLQTNLGVAEALLEGINSWVAVGSLEEV